MPFLTADAAVAGYGEPSTLSLVCVSSSYRFNVNSSYTYTKQKLVFFLSLSLALALFLLDFFLCSPRFIRPRRLLDLLSMFFSNCFTTFIILLIYFVAITLKILAFSFRRRDKVTAHTMPFLNFIRSCTICATHRKQTEEKFPYSCSINIAQMLENRRIYSPADYSIDPALLAG